MAYCESDGCCKPEPMQVQSDESSSSHLISHDNGCMRFSINCHPRELLDVLNVYRQSGKLCDISLRAEMDTFMVHRVVLAAASPYFRAMFCNGMMECGVTEVPLRCIRAEILSAIINFAYTSELCVCENNVCHLLSAGMMYEMPHVVNSCCTFLEHQLDPCNCIGIADFAQAHGCYQLYERARQYIYSHLTEVSKCEEFLSLSQSNVIQIIKRDELNVRCEEEVYEAVVRWVSHDVERRSARLFPLLSAVRCHFLPPSFIADQLRTSDLIRSAPQCCEFLTRVANELAGHQRCKEKPRQPAGSSLAVYIVGGYLRHSLNLVDAWTPETRRWYSISNLSMPRSGVAACQVHGKIYVIGGRNNTPDVGNVDSPAVDCLDIVTNEWKRCSDMTVARNRVAVAALDCMVYAVGGSHVEHHHQSVESCNDPLQFPIDKSDRFTGPETALSYDWSVENIHQSRHAKNPRYCRGFPIRGYNPESDCWSLVAPMSTARIGAGAAVVNRLLYAVGGYDGTNRLSSVERYHPERNEWESVASMSTTRSGAGVCSLDQYIYVVGGYDGSSQLSTVERYSVESGQWQSLIPMNLPRSALSLSSIGGKIYAIGGYDGAHFTPTIECYDPAEDNWTDAGSMSCGRSGHGAAVAIEPNLQCLTSSDATANGT